MSERRIQRIHSENVVLDIGHDVGALIIYTGKELHGREIEVSPMGNASRRVHTEVLERRAGGSPVFAAVFAELPAGDYDIWRSAPDTTGHVAIVGGEIAEVDWR